MKRVPEERIRIAQSAPPNDGGRFVLYWMIGARRGPWNWALDRAVELGRELGKPVLVLEALRAGYEHASDRHHRIVLEGMADDQEWFAQRDVRYYPYVEPEVGAGKGLLEALAEHAAAVVTDDTPTFFLPRMVRAVARRLKVRMEAVDGVGLFPLRSTDKVFPTAYAFRRFLQRELPAHLALAPRADAFAGSAKSPAAQVPREILDRWRPADSAMLSASPSSLAELPIDHDVAPVDDVTGGHGAALRSWRSFVGERLLDYDEDRNHPDREATSRASPWMHYGHLSTHEMFATIADHVGWSPDHLGEKANGSREGWWGSPGPVEAFLDQLVTWRELGHHFVLKRDDAYEYESLPDWALTTLGEHETDDRPHSYDLETFENAATHDQLWNAAQTQLRREGTIHNYLRMLWGKKILEWSPTPKQALRTLFHLNDKYALDGRDPNSLSGITWCLGRFDRPWPERPIYGKVRSMSSPNTARKVKLKTYLDRFTPRGTESLYS